MTVHELKTHPSAFRAVRCRKKKAEFRRNDRNFQVGDFLHLREWDPRYEEYTEDELMVYVTHLIEGGEYGIPEGFAMLSIEHIDGYPLQP